MPSSFPSSPSPSTSLDQSEAPPPPYVEFAEPQFQAQPQPPALPSRKPVAAAKAKQSPGSRRVGFSERPVSVIGIQDPIAESPIDGPSRSSSTSARIDERPGTPVATKAPPFNPSPSKLRPDRLSKQTSSTASGTSHSRSASTSSTSDPFAPYVPYPGEIASEEDEDEFKSPTPNDFLREGLKSGKKHGHVGYAGAKKLGGFLMEHVKKGEMPWTHWDCCAVVGEREEDGKNVGLECGQENHRLHKKCKKCGAMVTENCVKRTL